MSRMNPGLRLSSRCWAIRTVRGSSSSFCEVWAALSCWSSGLPAVAFRSFPPTTLSDDSNWPKPYTAVTCLSAVAAVSRQVATVTSCGVMDAIRRSQLDSALFVQAHAEVQMVLEHNLFPLFLRSDVYIKHTQSDNQTPTKLTSSTDQQNTVLPRQPDNPSLGSKTETLSSYNKANQTSRRTRDREKTHKHLPHTPVKMRTHTFISELMRRLQELHAAEEDAAVTDRSSLCHSQSTRDSSAHSLGYYNTERDFNTCEGHTHSTDKRHSGCAGLTVVYYLCGEVIPYRTCVQGNTVTLAQFKSLIMTHRDSYRFFFKSVSSDFDCDVFYEEIEEDETVLPTYDRKIIAKVERLNE
ncbi:axin-1-like [Triplophysa dalaica]|uniref:axin-1-like n=1 Tax=Triplophysa dalaica TaxID=1582913 RepID=UPI0024DF6723|nr:axin-1-like [Triplophysa dalaica]